MFKEFKISSFQIVCFFGQTIPTCNTNDGTTGGHNDKNLAPTLA